MELGDEIHKLLISGKINLFALGERLDLTYRAFSLFKSKINSTSDETITTKVPFGLDENGELIENDRIHTKDELLSAIDQKCLVYLPIDGISKLTSIIEAFFIECCYKVLTEYPQKIANKNKIDTALILKSESIEELKEYVIRRYINEITYQSPQDYTKEFLAVTGVNLNNSPLYEFYIELKATRDIHIHNDGIINSIYLAKVGKMARGKENEYLEVSFKYLFESYEICFQLFEFLDKEFHKIWHSSIYQQNIDSLIK